MVVPVGINSIKKTPLMFKKTMANLVMYSEGVWGFMSPFDQKKEKNKSTYNKSINTPCKII